jgi:hypothetical protein
MIDFCMHKHHFVMMQSGVNMFVSCLRRLLHKYNGYECKEPEPGKFTLAFRRLDDAVRCACHLQVQLLSLDWPEPLLQMSECRPIIRSGPHPIWMGLRVRVGMAYGYVTNKKPLNTGRADYFGVLANMAARVMGQAQPGQILLAVQEEFAFDDCKELTLGDRKEHGLSLFRREEKEVTEMDIPANWVGGRIPPPPSYLEPSQQVLGGADMGSIGVSAAATAAVAAMAAKQQSAIDMDGCATIITIMNSRTTSMSTTVEAECTDAAAAAIASKQLSLDSIGNPALYPQLSVSSQDVAAKSKECPKPAGQVVPGANDKIHIRLVGHYRLRSVITFDYFQ